MNQNNYSNADGLSSSSSIANTSDNRLKLGEFFYLRKTNRYSLICVHCYQEFDDFAKFSSHIEQHLLKWGIQSVKMETGQSASTTNASTTNLNQSVGYHDAMPTIFKNEFGQQSNTSEMPQYFYNGYNNNPPNWFNTNADGQQQMNSNNNNQSHVRKPTSSSSSSATQFDDEFNALKRQFNEPMFIINDTPEVRQLSQYLAENYPIEKRNSQYKCPCCEKLFNGSALARRHVYTHSVEKVFSCAGCSRKFSHARHLRDHIKSKHGNPANLPDRSHQSSTNRISSNRSSYDLNSQLGNHFLNSTSNHASSQSSSTMALTRNAGGTAFQSEFDALRTIYSDNKSIIVNDLPEIREISQYLMPNFEFAKINDQVMCPLCDGLFNSKSTVRRHLTNHLKVKMFRCAVCDREFRHARHLGEHIKQKHHGNFHMENSKQKSDRIKVNSNAIKSEPYDIEYNKIECYICHTKFKRRHKSLNESSANNFDDLSSPYCNNCHKEMAKRSIKQNVRGLLTDAVVHSKDGQMKFLCKYCNISFLDQKSLIMHEMQHTKPMKNEISNNQIMPMHIQ